MPTAILDGLAQVDLIGHVILATTLLSLLLAIVLNFVIQARYMSLERDLRQNGSAGRPFAHAVLRRIAGDAAEALRHSRTPNAQAIVEDGVQAELRPLLLAERFVRAATGLVIILGLLGTFYGLTLSIGRLVQLVSNDPAGVTDITHAITNGLTRTLSGMAVAFSNSLFGIGSAVILTIVGVFSNVTDRRTAFMIQAENYLDGVLAESGVDAGGERAAPNDARAGRLERTVAGFDESVARLQGAVAQFEGALRTFASTTRDFREFNLHLKDNVQRMSLSFGDFSEALKSEIVALKSGNGRAQERP